MNSRFSSPGFFLAALSALTAIAGCATDKTLPSDAPFAQGRYNPNPNPAFATGRSSAELVPAATPSAAGTAVTPKPMFNFDTTCTDPDTNRTYASTDPEFNGCVQKKQQEQKK